MNKSYSWNKYVFYIGVPLTVLAWIYMALIIQGNASNNSLAIVSILFVLIGTPSIIGYWFVDMRNRRLSRLAKNFGLNFEKLMPSTGSQEYPINRISGRFNNVDVLVEDHQRLHWVPAGGLLGGHIASRWTVFLANQTEQKLSSAVDGYARIGSIKRALVNLK